MMLPDDLLAILSAHRGIFSSKSAKAKMSECGAICAFAFCAGCSSKLTMRKISIIVISDKRKVSSEDCSNCQV